MPNSNGNGHNESECDGIFIRVDQHTREMREENRELETIEKYAGKGGNLIFDQEIISSQTSV